MCQPDSVWWRQRRPSLMSQRPLHLKVGRAGEEEGKVGLGDPHRLAQAGLEGVGGRLGGSHGLAEGVAVDIDGLHHHHRVAHDDGVAPRLPGEDGGGTAAQGGEVAAEQFGPHRAPAQGTQLQLTVVAGVLLGGGRKLDDAQHLVAPRLTAGGDGAVETVPAGSLVVDDDAADPVAQALAHEVANGDTAALAEPAVMRCGPLGRGTAENVKAEGTGGGGAVALTEAPPESLPCRAVSGIVHVNADAVQAETDAERVRPNLAVRGAQGRQQQHCQQYGPQSIVHLFCISHFRFFYF